METPSTETIRTEIEKYFYGRTEEPRKITVHTNGIGADMFGESIEEIGLGTYRMYLPKKLLRIAAQFYPRTSPYSGRKFKRLIKPTTWK